jgi:hypothetical protein
MLDESPALARRNIPRWSTFLVRLVIAAPPIIGREKNIHVVLRPNTDARTIPAPEDRAEDRDFQKSKSRSAVIVARLNPRPSIRARQDLPASRRPLADPDRRGRRAVAFAVGFEESPGLSHQRDCQGSNVLMFHLRSMI